MSHNKTPPSLFGHIAELGRTVSGNDLDVAAQKFLVLGRDILEAHANSESWRSARNLALQSQLGFSQPQCDFEFGVHPQRNGHFYEAASQAQIRNLAPYHWLSHRVQFRSDGALRPGGLAPVLVCKAKVVNHPGRQWSTVRFIQLVIEISRRNARMSVFTVQIGKMVTLYFLHFRAKLCPAEHIRQLVCFTMTHPPFRKSLVRLRGTGVFPFAADAESTVRIPCE